MSKTVRVASPISDVNPTGFVVINVSDFDPAQHTPFSDDDADVLRSVNLDELKPDVADGARGELQHIEARLRDEDARLRAWADELGAEANRQREQADILDAERLRLEALAKSLEQAAAPVGLTAAQLKEALTARGIEFKSNASKPELQALLDAAAPA